MALGFNISPGESSYAQSQIGAVKFGDVAIGTNSKSKNLMLIAAAVIVAIVFIKKMK